VNGLADSWLGRQAVREKSLIAVFVLTLPFEQSSLLCTMPGASQRALSFDIDRLMLNRLNV